MATLRLTGDTLELRMSRWERLGALANEYSIPVTSIVSVTRLTDARTAIRGVRLPGTGIPRIIALGRWRTRKSVDFLAVYRGRPGYMIELADQRFDRIVLSCDALPSLENLAQASNLATPPGN